MNPKQQLCDGRMLHSRACDVLVGVALGLLLTIALPHRFSPETLHEVPLYSVGKMKTRGTSNEAPRCNEFNLIVSPSSEERRLGTLLNDTVAAAAHI